MPEGCSSKSLAESLVGLLLEEAVVRNIPGYRPGDSYAPRNHPLNTPPGRSCKKCGSARVALPAYNTDYFDCLDCGYSWPQTDKQVQFMRTHPASMYSETVVTNDRVLNYVLTHAGEVIGRKDMSALAKFETLFAYLLKARREVLGTADV
jgi:hypothetical protein